MLETLTFKDKAILGELDKIIRGETKLVSDFTSYIQLLRDSI